MKTMLGSFDSLEKFFLVCAVSGGFFIIIRIMLQFVGSSSDMDMPGGHDAMDVHHADSDLGFKFLSVHGLSTFLMMFGLIGLALYRQSGVGPILCVPGAAAAGVIAVWIVGKLFQGAAGLQSSGTLDNRDSVGATGTVYLTIPEKGIGRVNIRFKGRLRECDAMAIHGEKLDTGTPIRVIKVSDSILMVERVA